MVVAVVLVIAPVRATYLNDVGSDTVEHRTASCGAPVVSLLGADPGLGGGSEHPIGGAAAEISCDAASGKRIIVALLLLCGASIGWGLVRLRCLGSPDHRYQQRADDPRASSGG